MLRKTEWVVGVLWTKPYSHYSIHSDQPPRYIEPICVDLLTLSIISNPIRAREQNTRSGCGIPIRWYDYFARVQSVLG